MYLIYGEAKQIVRIVIPCHCRLELMFVVALEAMGEPIQSIEQVTRTRTTTGKFLTRLPIFP